MQIQDVDLKLLRVFIAIVECGGLSAAEARLNIGRSTISSHLADLEIRLGVKLCSRGRAGFELTEAGQITYQASLELLQQCETFMSTIATSKDSLSGRLSISTIDTTINDPRCRLSDAISQLKARGGSVHVEINVCEPRETELAVLNGRSLVSFGVSRHSLRGLNYLPLYKETNYLYCGEKHPLFNCKKNVINEYLAQSEFITRGYLRDTDFSDNDLPCQQTATAFHDEGIAHLILSGHFIGYLPEEYAKTWTQEKKMQAIQPQQYHYEIPIVLITQNKGNSSALENAFIEEVKLAYGLSIN